jgi:hypothetical protein
MRHVSPNFYIFTCASGGFHMSTQNSLIGSEVLHRSYPEPGPVRNFDDCRSGVGKHACHLSRAFDIFSCESGEFHLFTWNSLIGPNNVSLAC